MHDHPGIYPTLPSREITDEMERWMLDPVRDTEWQTCWEYVLSHDLTPSEGAAFWTGANLAMEAARAHPTPEPAPVAGVEGERRG